MQKDLKTNPKETNIVNKKAITLNKHEGINFRNYHEICYSAKSLKSLLKTK